MLKNTSVITSPERESIDQLYIADSDSIVRIEAPLSPGMVLQVNNSDYVAPNAEGAPIVIGAASPDMQLSQSDADVFKKPRTGFDGWEIRLGDDCRQILLAPEVYSICYDDPLYAFNPNPETYTVTSGSIELVASGHAEGYQFSGWYDQPEGGRLVTEIPSGSTGDIVLYARWLVTDSYTVTFDANSGPSFPRVCQMPQPLSVAPGGGFIVPSQLPRRTCSVSYTHLDVYKRQVRGGLENLDHSGKSVSFFHLRQFGKDSIADNCAFYKNRKSITFSYALTF